MKRVRGFLCFLLALILLLATVPAGVSGETKTEQTELIEGEMLSEPIIAEYADPSARLASMLMVAEDDQAMLYYDYQTAQCAVLQKNTGNVVFSSPYNTAGIAASDEIKQKIYSPIRIVYYDDSMVQHEMNSFFDAAAQGQIESSCIENGVSARMVIGREAQQILLPRAIPAESFEEKVLSVLDGQPVKRLKKYYRKLDPDKYDEETVNDLMKDYPGIANGAIYILKDVGDELKKELEKYFVQSGYTYEQLLIDEKSILGADEEAKESTQAYFKLTLEYRLENGELVVTVPCDSIEYDTKKFKLQKIVLLEYFDAAIDGENAYLFLPDGSGALLDNNSNSLNAENVISGRFYGADSTLVFDRVNTLRKSFCMPVFGINKENNAVFGIVERGAEMTDLTAVAVEAESQCGKAFLTLNYSDVEKYYLTESDDAGQHQNSWSKVSDLAYTGDFSVRFLFLNGEAANYSGMATAYRNYLIAHGSLPEEITPESDLPFVFGALGVARVSSEFLFIPIQKSVAMTDFAKAQQLIEELSDAGVKNISLRYAGWANGGLAHTVFNKANIEHVLGGSQGYREMVNELEKKGIRVYPEVDLSFCSVDRFFDGFSVKRDVARRLNDTYALTYDVDFGSNIEDVDRAHMVVKPASMKKYLDRFLKKFQFENSELALVDLGSELHSDFSKNGINRQQSLEIVCEMLQNARKSHGLMVDGGNAYTFPYADMILNMSSSSSGYLQEKCSVPFMQMVLCGRKVYTGEAINLASDYSHAFLKAIENREGLYFVLAGQNSEALLETDYRFRYCSVQYDSWKDKIVEMYITYNRIYEQTANAEMTEHSYLADGVVCVTYSNEAKVIVNYTDQPYTFGNVVVAAQSASVA